MRVTANQVTIARLCGLPFIGFAIYGDTQLRIIGAIVGTLIGLTDFVDGYLARKYGSTVLGSLLDPVADKVFIVVCYACYADRGSMPWWIAAAVLSRELLVTVLRSSLELRGRWRDLGACVEVAQTRRLAVEVDDREATRCERQRED